MEVHEVAQLLRAMQTTQASAKPPVTRGEFDGCHVLVRTRSAGVHVGMLASKSGTDVVLTKARRLWCWKGAFTLSEVATAGVDKEGSRMSCEVPTIGLPEAIEIIPTTEDARRKFEVVRER